MMQEPLFTEHLVASVRNTALSHPGRKAVALVADPGHEGDEVFVDYASLDAQARRVAAALQRAGIPRGARVLLLFPQCTDFAAGYLGCLYAGLVAVPAPLPAGTAFEQLRVGSIARDCEAAAALTVSDVREAVEGRFAADDAPGPQVLAVDALPPSVRAEDWEPTGVDVDDVAVLQYTSGSTGDPKGVVLTHRHLMVNAENLFRGYGLPARTRFGGWIPMYHDMGLLALLTPALLSGNPCVLMDGAVFLRRPHFWLQMIDTFGIEFSAAPNFAYDFCVRRIAPEHIEKLDLSRWRCAANGSEPIHPATLTDFAKVFEGAGLAQHTLRPSYGLAEATVFVSAAQGDPRMRCVDAELLEEHRFVEARPGRPGRDVVCCGPVVGLDVAVVDPPTGRPAAAGGVGEILLRGPSVARGYWRKPQATAEVFDASDGDSGGWLRTGDLGTVHDGELYLTGRIKDMLIVHGRNIYPHDIEHQLRAHHPSLGYVGAVFTVPSPDPAERDPVIVSHEVQGRPDAEQSEELVSAIRQTLAREFGLHAAGVVLLRRGGVARTTSGKVQRRLMRDLFQRDALKSVHADPGARRLMGNAAA